jgi:hypothetical protein
VRRGHLLDVLDGHDWHLGRAAEALGTGVAQLGLRLESAGFGSLLRQDVLDGYRARARHGRESRRRRGPGPGRGPGRGPGAVVSRTPRAGGPPRRTG